MPITAFLPLLLIPLTPSLQNAPQPTGATSNGGAGMQREDTAPSQEGAISRVLDLGMRIGDPFPNKDAMPIMPNEAHAAKAHSIVRLAAVARQRGLDRSDDLVRTVDAVKQILLVEKLMQTMSDAIVIDQKEVRDHFDRSPDRYDEFEMSHIFLSSAGTSNGGKTRDGNALARAREAQARLKAGEPFASVARALSDDRESASDGGVLPVVLGASIQPAFFATVGTMKEGMVSDIVKGPEGYHIIKLVKRNHDFGGPARDMIEREIKEREMLKLLPELRRLEEGAK